VKPLQIEIPKDVLVRDTVRDILANWQKKRKGLLGPLLFPDSCRRQLQRIEKYYVPHFLFTFHQSTRTDVEIHYVLIDAVCGFGAYTNVEPELSTIEPEGAFVFRVLVSQQKARAKALEWLSRWNLRKHAFHLKAPEILNSHVRLFHFPFWAAYYERPSRKLDVEVVDGLRGCLEGGRTKYMIETGMMDLKRNASRSLERTSCDPKQ
jgi:hypothetical protein